MALRAAVYASLPLTLLGANMAPGCDCEVSHCCEAFNNSYPLAYLFNGSLPSYSSTHTVVPRDRGGYSAACSFLNLVPGVFEQEDYTSPGVCSDLAKGMGTTTVCEAIAASAEARGRLQAGRSVLSAFLEPGICAELQDGACFESREGNAAYTWDTSVPSWCWAGLRLGMARLQWGVTCPEEGGLSIQAKWMDDNATDGKNGSCSADGSGNYSGGLQATVRVDDWMGGSGGSPRWRCFDIPRGDIGSSDYRILAYSVGDLPCAVGSSTTPISSGSSRKSLAALVHAAAAAVAVAAMV